MISRYTDEVELREYIGKIFKIDMSVPYAPTEVLGESAVFKYLLHYQNKKLILYGAGKIGFVTLIWLKKEGIKTEFIVDTDENKRGIELLGVPVVCLNDLKEKLKENLEYILLITADLGIQANNVKRELFEIGIKEIMDVHYWDFHPNTEISELNIYNARLDFMEVFEKLGDMKSKEIMCEILRCRLYDDLYRLPAEPSSEKYWGNGIFEPVPQETLLCLGGSNGDTLFYFFEKYTRCNRVIVFEPGKMRQLKDNLKILPAEIREKIVVEEYYAANCTIKNTIRIDDWTGGGKK